MNKQVLVAYASKYGATAEIAEHIGQVLEAAGFSVDVEPADKVTDLAGYSGIVLGSAVYAGQWRKEAAAFLEAHEQTLANRPVWLFSSGPTGAGDPVTLMKGWRFPEGLQPIVDRIQPRDMTLFGGSLDVTKLNFLEKMIVKAMKAPVGDFRDWDMIDSWATGIATVLQAEVSEPMWS
jgi:menaquinone-dependent protoporphyrinogen oxidase